MTRTKILSIRRNHQRFCCFVGGVDVAAPAFACAPIAMPSGPALAPYPTAIGCIWIVLPFALVAPMATDRSPGFVEKGTLHMTTESSPIFTVPLTSDVIGDRGKGRRSRRTTLSVRVDGLVRPGKQNLYVPHLQEDSPKWPIQYELDLNRPEPIALRWEAGAAA